MAPQKALSVRFAMGVFWLSVILAGSFTLYQAGILFIRAQQCRENTCRLAMIDWPRWFPFLTKAGFDSLYFGVLFVVRTVVVLLLYGLLLVVPAAIAVMCTLYCAANRFIDKHVHPKRRKPTSPRNFIASVGKCRKIPLSLIHRWVRSR